MRGPDRDRPGLDEHFQGSKKRQQQSEGRARMIQVEVLSMKKQQRSGCWKPRLVDGLELPPGGWREPGGAQREACGHAGSESGPQQPGEKAPGEGQHLMR